MPASTSGMCLNWLREFAWGQHFWATRLQHVFVLRHTPQKKQSSRGGQQSWGKGWRAHPLRTAWLPGLEAERCLPALCSFVRGDGEGGCRPLFLTHVRAAPGGSDWTSGKNLLTMKVVKHWNKLSGEVVDALCLLKSI